MKNEKIKETIDPKLSHTKESPEIQERNVINYIKDNLYYFIGGLAVVIVAVFLIIFTTGSSDKKEKQASLYLSRLYTYIDTQEYKTALDGDKSKTMRGEQIYGLTYIVNNYKGTKSGKLASVFAGNCYLKMNQPQKAIEYFEISLKSDDPNVLEGANAGLGCAYEMNQQIEKASEHYSKASEYAIDDENKARYLLFSAICLEQLKKIDLAKEDYTKVINLSPNSEYSDIAKANLSRLGIVID
ncbi:tetratricopeptide repeat protein [bacterium]|nr:tetratricopeptide repeat protein [bacterium]